MSESPRDLGSKSDGWRPVKKLAAPPDYNWNDEEVLYEKNDSWLTGCMVGVIVGVIMASVLALLMAC